MEKNCICCGMPMKEDRDYPAGDRRRDYFVHCALEDGSMKSFEQAVEGMTGFVMKVKGLDQEQARQAAVLHLEKMPAWKNRNN